MANGLNLNQQQLQGVLRPEFKGLGTPQGLGVASQAPEASTPGLSLGGKPLGALGKVGVVLEAIGAGGRGQTPLFLKLQEQERQRKLIRLQEVKSKIGIVSDVVGLTKGLSGKDREKAIKNAKELVGNDPQMFGFIDAFTDRPDMFGVFEDWVKSGKDPVATTLGNREDIEGLLKYAATKQGHESHEEFTNSQFAPRIIEKFTQQKEWLKQNDPDLFKKIAADGITDLSELQKMNDTVPTSIQLDDEEFPNISSDSQSGLRERLGIGTDEGAKKTKAVFDKVTDEPVFATEKQIQSEPDRFVPIEKAESEATKTTPSRTLQVDIASRLDSDPIFGDLSEEDKKTAAFKVGSRINELLKDKLADNAEDAMDIALDELADQIIPGEERSINPFSDKPFGLDDAPELLPRGIPTGSRQISEDTFLLPDGRTVKRKK